MEELIKLTGSFVYIDDDGVRFDDHDLQAFVYKAIDQAIAAVRLEERYNIIREKRRLTYSDVDDAYRLAVQDQQALEDKFLNK